MKKWQKMVAFLGLGLLTLGLASACSRPGSSKSGANSNSSTPAKKVKKSKSSSKTLILYFSLTGTTKQAAQYIQKQTGADMIRLQPQKRYKGYNDASKRGERELRNNIHPALATKIPDFSKYDMVLIGYPTWWSRPPMLIHTLFDNYNFKGKTVVPFTTSMSTPVGPSQKVVKRLARADGADFKPGIRYDDNNKQIRNWLKNLGLEK